MMLSKCKAHKNIFIDIKTKCSGGRMPKRFGLRARTKALDGVRSTPGKGLS